MFILRYNVVSNTFVSPVSDYKLHVTKFVISASVINK